MSPQLISTLINVAILALVLLGFLFGLKGAKKSVWGLCSFVIGFALALIFTPLVSKLILRISINGESVNTMIANAIIDALGEEYASNELIKEVTANYPLLLVNIVSYIVLMFVLMGFVKLLSVIVYKIVNGKKNKQVNKECKMVNGKPQVVVVKEKEKKHRLLGGLVKAVETFAFLLCLILPLNGLIKTFNKVAETSTVSAETVVEENDNSLSSMIKQNVPNEVLDTLACYENSIFFKISNIAGINTKMLNQVASTKVNGEVIKLGDELNALVVIYDDYNYATSLDFSDTETLKSVDFDRVRNFIKTISNMGTFKALFEDGVNMALNEWSPEAGTTEYVAKQATQDVLNEYSLKHFADDLLSVVDIAEIAVNEGLVEEFIKEKADVDVIIDLLSKNNEELSKKLVSKIFGINLLNKGIVSFTNVAIYELENELKTTEGLENISLPRVIVKDAKIEPNEINSILSGFYSAYNELKKLNTIDPETNNKLYFTDVIDKDPAKLFSKATTENNNYRIYNVITSIGDAYDAMYSLNYLNNNGTLNALFAALDNYEETNKYVSFITLKNSIKNDFTNLATAVDVLVNTDLMDLIIMSDIDDSSASDQTPEEPEETDKYADIKNVLENLSKVSGNGKTFVNVLLTSLFNINSITPSINFLSDKMTEALNDMFVEVGKELERDYDVITKFNISALISKDTTLKNAEVEKLASIIENLAKLSDDGLLDVIDEGSVAKIIETVNLETTGKLLQSIKELTLLSDYKDGETTKEGVYKTYIKEFLMKTGFNKYINFEPTLKDEYSWYDELRPLTEAEIASNKHNVNSFVTYIKDIKVKNSENVEVSLIEFLFDSNSDYNDLINQLSSEQLNAIIDNVFDIEILKPISVMLTNIINKSVESIVSDTLTGAGLDVNIPEIDEIPEEQVEDVKKIVTSITKILDDVKDNDSVKDTEGNVDFTKVDITTIKTDTLTDIIVALDENAQKADGVLKDTYTAVKDYLKTELGDIQTSDGKTLEQIITESETSGTNIDWKTIAPDLIEKYKASKA